MCKKTEEENVIFRFVSCSKIKRFPALGSQIIYSTKRVIVWHQFGFVSPIQPGMLFVMVFKGEITGTNS